MFLAALAGYGYRLWRIAAVYVGAVLAFTFVFMAVHVHAGEAFDWLQFWTALQLSLNAIHGRVFFARIAVDSAESWVATIESILGIAVESVFVAVLIQRFFGK